MTKLVKLDDLSLSLILARLSIQDVWTSGRVCVRLSGARRKCAKVRRELALMVGKGSKDYVDESGFNIPESQLLVDENGVSLFHENDQNIQNVQLQIYSFPQDFVRLLLTHFTNLTTLTISNRANSEEIESIIHLLEQFNRPNGTLHTLKLYSNYYDQYEQSSVSNKIQTQNVRLNLRLLSVVNSISSLRKLTFDGKAKFCRNDKYPRIDLPILAQLEQFEFNSVDQFSCWHNSITRYAMNNARLRSIGFHYLIMDFTWLLALSTELASRFTHLHINVDFTNCGINNDYESLCRHFSHLTSLEIIVNWTLQPLGPFHALIHLHNLISLVVNIDSHFMTPLGMGPPGLNFEILPVKVFTISITSVTRDHHFFHQCNLIRLFPNVQVVRVIREVSLCAVCKPKKNGLAHCDVIALEEYCARHMFCHFTHSRQLSMVYSKVVGDDVVGIRDRKWLYNQMGLCSEDEEED